MSEPRALYTTLDNNGNISADVHYVGRLSTRNLEELERDLAQLERKLVPLLNCVRAMRGKKPVIVPGE